MPETSVKSLEAISTIICLGSPVSGVSVESLLHADSKMADKNNSLSNFIFIFYLFLILFLV